MSIQAVARTRIRHTPSEQAKRTLMWLLQHQAALRQAKNRPRHPVQFLHFHTTQLAAGRIMSKGGRCLVVISPHLLRKKIALLNVHHGTPSIAGWNVARNSISRCADLELILEYQGMLLRRRHSYIFGANRLRL